MNLLRLLSMVASFGIAYALMWVGAHVRLNRQRAKNAPQLRSEIEAQVLRNGPYICQRSRKGRVEYPLASLAGAEAADRRH
jgi:hypothetical protein